MTKHRLPLQGGSGEPGSHGGNPFGHQQPAASGGDDAILDAATRQRAEALIRARQRIHAGRMLADYPGANAVVPDLRPEEAREGISTAEAVVRSVLDWLARFPVRRTE